MCSKMTIEELKDWLRQEIREIRIKQREAIDNRDEDSFFSDDDMADQYHTEGFAEGYESVLIKISDDQSPEEALETIWREGV